MPGHLISPAVQRKGRKRTPSGAVRGHNAHIHFIYGEILDPVVAAEIVVMDRHFGGVGKIQQLPGEPQLNIVAVRYKIRERIKLGALRVGIAVFQPVSKVASPKSKFHSACASSGILYISRAILIVTKSGESASGMLSAR